MGCKERFRVHVRFVSHAGPVLTTLLLPAFGYLYMRFRDTRTLLCSWDSCLRCPDASDLQAALVDVTNGRMHPWVAAASQTSIQICSAMFLASLSPLRFRIGRLSMLYVIPFTIPLVAYSILFHGVFRGVTPGEPKF